MMMKLHFTQQVLYSLIYLSCNHLWCQKFQSILNFSLGEGQEVQAVTFHQLRNKVTVLASALKNHGVKKGDRIVGVLEVTITLVSFINALSKESNADFSAIVITLQNFYSKKIPSEKINFAYITALIRSETCR